MSRVLREVLTEDRETVEILIEMDDRDPELSTTRSAGFGTDRAQGLGAVRGEAEPAGPFTQGMNLVRSTASQVAKTVGQVQEDLRPSKVEVQMGVKFDSEAGALIAKTSGGSHLQVTLTWEADKP